MAMPNMRESSRALVGNHALLTVRDLVVHYHTSRGAVQAVNGVSFDLRPGERLGLVDESGSGKSIIALALPRLIRPPGRIESGEMILDDIDLPGLTEEEMQRVRLAKIALMAQGAMNSLNPVLRVKEQLRDGLRDHGALLSGRAFDDRAAVLLHSVGLRRDVAEEKGALQGVPGLPPSLLNRPLGCSFRARCPRSTKRRRPSPPSSAKAAAARLRWHACCSVWPRPPAAKCSTEARIWAA